MRKGVDKKVVLLIVWLALLGGLLAWINRAPPKEHQSKNSTPHIQPDPVKIAALWPQVVAHAVAPARGNSSARYTIAEFGDFQCPQCGKARPLLEKLLAEYPAQVNLIFVHRPFPNIHEWAIPAGQASEIAAAQGKFWPMYDVLYAHQDDLETGFYTDYAAKAGLDKTQFKTAFDAGTGKDKVAASTSFADSLNIQQTPTLLLHDNTANTVKIYMGLDTKSNVESGNPYSGLNELVSRPPWAVKASAFLPSAP